MDHNRCIAYLSQDGFLTDLLKRLKVEAGSLGFSAAICYPSPVGPFNDIMSSLHNLPSDRLHVLVVSCCCWVKGQAWLTS